MTGAESGIAVKEICHKYGIGKKNLTIYQQRKKHSSIESSDNKRLLEAENRKLKQMFV
ncbi:MAG: hypothetical protein J6568_00960 [Snodgrassella sp.]|nr:hypothetical protein [Snodgrassella sp.]